MNQYIKRLTIDDVIQECNSICSSYEIKSMADNAPIENQKDYMKHYQIAEWLQELKAYRDMKAILQNTKSIKRSKIKFRWPKFRKRKSH